MGDTSISSARTRVTRRWNRGRRLALAVLTILGVMALPAAAAQADSTWRGASTTSAFWSDPANWDVVPVPATAGTLTFPTLAGCVAPMVCYTSRNNLTGVNATGLSFTNTTGGYRILGNGLSVGSGGITDTPGGTSTQINAPLSLTANQIWKVGGGFGPLYDSLSIIGTVTGSAFSVGVAFTPGTGNGSSGDLYVTSDMEVGPVTVTGSGSLHIGGSAGGGSVNGGNGNPVAINSRARLIANPNSKVGALSVTTGGKLLLGTGPNNVGAVTLAANHGTSPDGVSLDSSSSTQTYISNNGPTPGTDFSQVSATGNVTLGGRLILAQGPASGGTCATLSRGDVATLFTTTGTLSGTFTGVPNGAIIPMAAVTGSCPSPPQVQIKYTANSVTATVVSGTTPTTTALAAPSPSTATTNQPVTLTATVTTTSSGTVAPAGTVAFASSGTAIPGCTAQPVTPTSGSNGTATCTTSFPAASSPESLTAAFTGTTASGQGSSISGPRALTVTKASSTTTLTASTKSPAVGGSVTYTATVTPGVGGPTKPSGTVQFRDGGTAIAGCGGRPLTAGSSSSTATCTVTYPSAGSHSIIAGYGGDASFGPSSSPATSVNVQGGPPPPGISATTSRATHVTTTRATLNGRVTTGGAAVSWQFQYGQGGAYNKGTPLRTITAGRHVPVSVSWTLKRLSPNVRYHFRLVVSTQSSSTAAVTTADGKALTFKTRATGRLLLPTGRLLVIGGTILVPEKCQSSLACNGRFSITTTARVGTKRTLGTVLCTTRNFRVRAHRTLIVRARITRVCQTLLRRKPHHRMAAKFTSRPRSGQFGLIRKITLVLR